MIRTDLTKEQKKSLDKKHEEDMKIALQRRSGALESGVIVSEVTGRGRLDIDSWLVEGKDYSGPTGAWNVEAHHILGRNKPKGFKGLHPTIQEFWPHIPPGCIYLTTAEHQHAARNSKMMRPLLLRFMLMEYPGEEWQGRDYWEWLNEPPYKEWL